MMASVRSSRGTYDMFVKNIPPMTADMADKVLRNQFDCFGAIASTEVRMGKQCTNYVGFVRFQTEEGRARALESNREGFTVDGIRCVVSMPPQPRLKTGAAEQRNFTRPQNEIDPTGLSVQPLLTARMYESIENVIGFHGEIEVLVTSVDSACFFWGQKIDTETAEITQAMFNDLQSMQLNRISGQMQAGKLYAALFSQDGCWYRCRLVNAVSADKSEVLFVDYGNSEVVAHSDVAELPNNFSILSPYASRYWLFGCILPERASEDQLNEGLKTLEMLKEHPVKCKIFPKTPAIPDAVPVRAVWNDVDVGLKMCNMHYVAQLHPDVLRSYYAAQFPSLVAKSPVNVSSTSASNFNGRPGSQMAAMEGRSPDKKVQPQRLNPPPHISRATSAMSSGDPGGVVNTGGSVRSVLKGCETQDTQALVSENSQLKRELQRCKQEKDAFQRKLADDTEVVLGSLRKQIEELKESNTKLSKKTLHNKMQTMLSDLSSVLLLRAQFPSSDEKKDEIESAYDLVSDDKGRLLVCNVVVLKQIEAAESEYQSKQLDITALQEKIDQLDEMIDNRNRARSTLYDLIVEFLDEVQHIAFDEKTNQIKVALTNLKTTYSNYLTMLNRDDKKTDLTVAMNGYSSWKAKKLNAYEDLRQSTDKHRSDMAAGLDQISKMLASNSLVATEIQSLCDLDSLSAVCHDALLMEIKRTNESQTNEEKTLIRNVVQSLVYELERELDDIGRLQLLQVKYTEHCASLKQWLNDRPNIEELQEVQQRIRGLKSKLRHLLADLADAQEDTGVSPEQVSQIEENLAQLRYQLHMEFTVEDRLLNHLTQLAIDHFPELIVKYPEFNLASCNEYGGLLKYGRSMDQFDLKPLCTHRRNVYKTMYCGKPVVLKEYAVGDIVGISPSDFVRRLVTYSKVGEANTLQPFGFFYQQADRLVVVQLPFMESNLLTLVESQTVTSEMRNRILIDILYGLETLHQANLVHGAIHPHNILLDSSGRGHIADCDFTKMPLRRAEHVFTASSGLKFAAPEVSLGSISAASDMFNFGIIILFLYHRDQSFSKFSLNKQGIPDITGMKLPQGLLKVVQSLLQISPQRRSSATQLLQNEFFKNLPDDVQLGSTSTAAPVSSASEVDKPTGSEELTDLVSDGAQAQSSSGDSFTDTSGTKGPLEPVADNDEDKDRGELNPVDVPVDQNVIEQEPVMSYSEELIIDASDDDLQFD